ncbi:MAG: hypothetical protein AAFR35_10755 [Pseudomonadota bacterium]
MKHAYSALVALLLTLSPAVAEEEPGSMDQGADLVQEGLRLLLEGFVAEMEPAFRELEGLLSNLDAYHAPEVLPNGDIIIRRKRPDELEAAPDDDIEI